MRFALALLPILLSAPARAVELHYEAYAGGLNVLDMTVDFDVAPDQYRVKLTYRTVGGFNLLMRSAQTSEVEGRFVGDRPVPRHFYSSGILKGANRVTEIDYSQGQPHVLQLLPPPDQERELVPAMDQANTIDTLSAMAELIHLVNRTGNCNGQARTFDGRRLSMLEAHTSGPQPLEPTGRSSYAGPTLRCDFVGRQLAGFMLDEDRTKLQQPQQGTAWFASVQPGGPMVPVRIAFKTRWFGDATMYVVR